MRANRRRNYRARATVARHLGRPIADVRTVQFVPATEPTRWTHGDHTHVLAIGPDGAPIGPRKSPRHAVFETSDRPRVYLPVLHGCSRRRAYYWRT
jgi:hypothetical protein